MPTQPKILVWEAYNFKKMQKTGFRSVGDVSSKSCKNQTKGDRPQIWLKMIIMSSSHRLRRITGFSSQNFGLGGL